MFVSKSSESLEPQLDSEEENDNSEEVSKCPVSHSAAAHMFEQCLTWLEYQPEASAYNTSVLWQLQALSASKRMSNNQKSRHTLHMKITFNIMLVCQCTKYLS